jgi:phosphoserine phosphatase RsbU/P
MKILIAGGDLASRTLLEAVLKKWGYTVVSAADGTDARDKLQGPDAPRLALLDWMMPGMSGPDLCRRAREDRDPPAPLYLILLTARGEARHIVQGLDAGADDYIAKPFDNEELRARLDLARRFLDLQAAAARKDDLENALRTTRSLCHDLNQPLQAVSGYAELLSMTLPEDAPQRPTLGRIVDSVDRLGGLVEKLMRLARRHTQS